MSLLAEMGRSNLKTKNLLIPAVKREGGEMLRLLRAQFFGAMGAIIGISMMLYLTEHLDTTNPTLGLVAKIFGLLAIGWIGGGLIGYSTGYLIPIKKSSFHF